VSLFNKVYIDESKPFIWLGAGSTLDRLGLGQGVQEKEPKASPSDPMARYRREDHEEGGQSRRQIYRMIFREKMNFSITM